MVGSNTTLGSHATIWTRPERGLLQRGASKEKAANTVLVHDSMVHIVHPPKFNRAPEQSFVGEYCPCGKVYFKGYVKLPGCTRV